MFHISIWWGLELWEAKPTKSLVATALGASSIHFDIYPWEREFIGANIKQFHTY